jgi:hypothetical protein
MEQPESFRSVDSEGGRAGESALIAEPDRLEKVLLGAAPTDQVDIQPLLVGVLGDLRPARLTLVQMYLQNRPDLKKSLAQEFEQAWEEHKQDRQEFLSATAETRARLMSQAELSHWQDQGKSAAREYMGELARYLDGIA